MSLRESLIGMGVLVGLLAGSVFIIDSCHKEKANAQVQEVGKHEGAANVVQSEAKAADSKVPALEKRLKEAQTSVAQLKAELEAIKSQTPPEPVEDPIIRKQAGIILAQDNEIKVLKEEVVVLSEARDKWKQTAEERLRQAQAQEAATAAWKAAVSTSTNKGRIQGFAVGLALGFIGAKL